MASAEAAGSDVDDVWDRRKEALIFLVDFSAATVDPQRHGDTPLLPSVLAYMSQVLKDMIVERAADFVAVVAYGTMKNIPPLYPPERTSTLGTQSFLTPRENVSVVLGLAPASAQSILLLSELATDSKRVEQQYGHLPNGKSMEFRHALWHARNELHSGPATARKKIVILTNNDNPCLDDDQEIDYCRTSVRDLLELRTTIELAYCIPDAPLTFQSAHFFDEILVQTSNESMTRLVSSQKLDFDDIRLLKPKARKKFHAPRIYRKTFLKVGDKINIHLDVYLPLVPVSKPGTLEVEREHDATISKKRQTLCEGTGRVLGPDDVRHAFYFMNSWVTFTGSEYNTIKEFIEPGLHLQGFRPRSSLKRHHHLRPAYFLRPTDVLISGSETHFKALCTAMISHDVVASVLYRLSSPAARIGALVPFVDDSGGIVGMHLITLPFAEDLRAGWRAGTDPPTDGMKDTETLRKAVDIISVISSKLVLEGFDCAKYHNEMIQRYWAGLQAVALDNTDDGLALDDHIELVEHNEQRMVDLAGPDLTRLLEITAGLDFDVESTVVDLSLSEAEKKKRSAEAAKKRKRKSLCSKLDGEGVDYRNPDMETASATQLGDLLALHAQIKSGRRDAKIERLQSHLESCTCDDFES